MKKDLQSLQEKFDEADLDNTRGRSRSKAGTSAPEIGSYLLDQVQQVQMRLSELDVRCEKGHAELDGKCTALTTVVESGAVESASGGQAWPWPGCNEHGASDRDVVSHMLD